MNINNVYNINWISNSLAISSILIFYIFSYLVAFRRKIKLNKINDYLESYFLYYSLIHSIGKLIFYDKNNSNIKLCKFQGFLKVYSSYGVMINILILNLIIYFVIKNPSEKIIFNKYRIMIYNFLLLSACITLYMLNIFGSNKFSIIKYECDFSNNIISYNIMFYGFYILPIIITLPVTIYVMIFKVFKFIKLFENESNLKILNIWKYYPLIYFLTNLSNFIIVILEKYEIKNNYEILFFDKLISGLQGLFYWFIYFFKRRNYYFGKNNNCIKSQDLINSNLF